MSFSKMDRNIQTKSGIFLPSSSIQAASLNNSEFVSVISETLQQAFGGSGKAIKTAMKYTGASERTVKNWFQGKNGPNGDNLIKLMRHSDEIFRVTILMAGRNEHVAGDLLLEARGNLLEIIDLIDQVAYKKPEDE